jgi:hypothetical protein
MSTPARNTATPGVNATIDRIRDLNDRIIKSARSGGEASLDAYEQLLMTVADAQEQAGDRTADWVRGFAHAQAGFTRNLAEALPAAARSIGERTKELGDTTARQARRVPGVTQAEGEVRGAVAREEDLPIRNYDELNADEVIGRLERLSDEDVRKVDAYERRHRNRKTVRRKVEALTT